jgi:hypothetical protein
MPGHDLEGLAAEAFLYGYPLVFDLSEVERFTKVGMGALPAAPFNRFSHATQLAGPADTVVSVNNDTIYSIAHLDLGAGPLVLQVPDTAGRYYVLQFVDAWTNNFAYVGSRATGTSAGRYLLTPPGWEGTVPADAVRISCPTRVASIVGRWACAGRDDLPAVAALQQRSSLAPLAGSDAGTGSDVGSWPDTGTGLPTPTAGVPVDLELFEKLRVWMRAFPPAPVDVEHQQRFRPMGLLDDESPFLDASPELVKALTAGVAAGQERIETLSKAGTVPPVNGWHSVPHIFDYNLDFFEVGTLDDPKWKIADRDEARVTRALAARVGLWGNHGYEAAYAQVFQDSDGLPLSGGHRYRIRLDSLPPVGAFWSLTMYDIPDYYLVANPINRYSIGDRTPGLHRGPDGSLTLLLQYQAPDDADQANWLPAPEGDFRPMMRMYQPGGAVLDGSYRLPPVVRVE